MPRTFFERYGFANGTSYEAARAAIESLDHAGFKLKLGYINVQEQ
jgi:hypothetical protein